MGKYNFIFISIILALSVPTVFFLTNSIPDWSFFLWVLLVGLFINIAALYVVSRNLRNLFFQYFYLVLIVWYISWFVIYHLIADETSIPYGGFNLKYDRYALPFYFVWLAPALVTILLYPWLKLINGRIGQANLLLPVETNFKRKAVVAVFFVFNLIYFFTNLSVEIPVISYLGRVGHTTSLLFLFWIGYWNTRLGILFYLTLILMMTIAVFELLTGSRFGPLITILLLGLGYYFSSKLSTKWKLRLAALAAFPFIILFLGYVERVRNLIGRGNLEDVSLERIDEVRKAADRLDVSRQIYGDKASAFVEGIARNVNWVDVSVISASDQKVSYRGDRNLKRELDNILSLAFFSSGSSREGVSSARNEKLSLGLGTAPARDYGFTVNERTSVEWSILSDGYSRGGFGIYLLYLTGFLIIFNLIELFIKLGNKNGAEQKLLLCVFLDLIIKSNALPFYEIFRSIILHSIFYLVIILLLRIMTSFWIRKR